MVVHCANTNGFIQVSKFNLPTLIFLSKSFYILTGEKPYACPVCPRAFNQRVVLREHIRSHHSAADLTYGTADAPYYCTVCGDTFKTPQQIIQHLIEHSDSNTVAKRQPAVVYNNFNLFDL